MEARHSHTSSTPPAVVRTVDHAPPLTRTETTYPTPTAHHTATTHCHQVKRAFARKETSESARHALKEVALREVSQLTALARVVAGDLDPLQRRKLVALITSDVHHRDMTQEMVEAGVDDESSFTWQMQLKFSWEEGEDDVGMPHSDCVVRQANACLPYLYEYQGATTRLVVTPLTDRCWMTITGALHLSLGGAPAGAPACPRGEAGGGGGGGGGSNLCCRRCLVVG